MPTTLEKNETCREKFGLTEDESVAAYVQQLALSLAAMAETAQWPFLAALLRAASRPDHGPDESDDF